MSSGCRPRREATICSATALARAALGANSARARPDYFVAAAMRTDDVHEHVSEGFLDAISVTVTVTRYLRFPVVGGMARDHVDQFISAGPRQIRNRTIERFLFHFADLFERQFGLSATRRSRFLVAFDELAGEPAKNVVSDAGGVPNVGIFGETARFEPLICEFLH